VKQSKALWQRALLAAIFIVVALAMWRYTMPSQTATAQRVRSDIAASDQGRQPTTKPAANTQPQAGPAQQALDLAALRKSLAGRADAQAEVQRIVAFARFRDQVAEYGSGRASMPEKERAKLARQILAELPEHVARNEIVPVQAEALSVALLTDAEADPAVRSEAIKVARQQWDAYSHQSVGPSPAQDPRYQAYARQSRDVIEQVQASVPDPQQQQLVIAQRLQALRVQLFDHTSSPNAQ
jgi:phospholipase C accessory protein PlcR